MKKRAFINTVELTNNDYQITINQATHIRIENRGNTNVNIIFSGGTWLLLSGNLGRLPIRTSGDNYITESIKAYPESPGEEIKVYIMWVQKLQKNE